MRELISLTNLLLEENKLTREQSERIAQEWIQDIVDDFGRSGSSNISGLGTFHQRKAGAIFTADDGLSLANLLPPIPGFSEQLESAPEPVATIPAEPEVADSEPTPAAPETDPKEPKADTESDSDVEQSSIADSPDEERESSEEGNLVEEQNEEDESDSPSDKPEDVEEEDSTSDSGSSDIAKETETETETESEVETEEESEAQVKAGTEKEVEADVVAKAMQAPRSRTPNRRPQGQSRAALMIGSVIALAGISALIYVFAFQSRKSDIVPDQEVTSTVTAQAEGIDETATSVDGEIENDGAIDDPPEQVEAALDPPPAAASVDDDSRNTFTRNTDGYTLMVGSHLTRAQAEGSIISYSSLGLPLGVLEYQTDEVTRYRMGVGIFQTIDSAVEALESLRDHLPAETWIYRIR